MSSRQRLEDRFNELYINEDNQDPNPPLPYRPVPTHQAQYKNGLPTFKPVIYSNPEDSDSGDEYPASHTEPQYYPPYVTSAPQIVQSTQQHGQVAHSSAPPHHHVPHSLSDEFIPAPKPAYATYIQGPASSISGASNGSSMKYTGPVSTGYPAYSQPSGFAASSHNRQLSQSSQLSAEIDHLYESIKPRPPPSSSNNIPQQSFTPYRPSSHSGHNQSPYMGQEETGYTQNSYNADTNSPTSAQNIYETIRSHQKDVRFPESSGLVPLPSDQPISKPVKTGKEAEVDALTNLLLQNMEASADPDFFGMCAKCGQCIMGEDSGCTALEQVYHIKCFTCVTCDMCLKGTPFFAMESKPYCESCYMNTLEKCSVCSKAITDRILRATGKPYHPGCFTCVVCGKSLDGVPFTVDATNQIHCIEDFHKKFAPRCCVCARPIMPEPGREETIRIVALDRSFHVHCYKCEDCGLLLSSEADGRGCYPLDDHILCKNCNAKRIQAMTTKMTTEL